MVYTVKQLADLAGISPRTLHFYDEIGLLKPASHGENGYRYYGEESLLRLQQILFYRELDFNLKDIRALMERPDFDVMQALQSHKQALQRKAKRLNRLIATIDKTLLHLKGKTEMDSEELFEAFDEEKQKRYEQEASQLWGDTHVKESRKRWDRYSPKQKQAIMDEGKVIYTDLIPLVGTDPTSEAVQKIIARWHQHLRHFYEPTKEILLGLGQAYSQQPDFAAFYRKLHPDMPQFLTEAITYYCEHVLVVA